MLELLVLGRRRGSDDVELDVLSGSLLSSTSTQGGALSDDGTDITYTPPDDFNGSDTFDYQVSDGNGGTDVGTVTVGVAG